jgi:hypothetical protein
MIRDPRFKYMIHIKCFKMFLHNRLQGGSLRGQTSVQNRPR